MNWSVPDAKTAGTRPHDVEAEIQTPPSLHTGLTLLMQVITSARSSPPRFRRLHEISRLNTLSTPTTCNTTNNTLEMAATMEATTPAQPYVFDLGHLMCTDPNPLPSLTTNKEAVLANTAQSCAQSLINQLLTACPIQRSADGDLQLKLPDPTFPLPREKPVPKEKEKSKWEKFAAKKGIKATKREGKLVFDEGKGEWVPRYGYKGKKGGDGGPGDWLVEVEEEKPEKPEQEVRKRRDGEPVKGRSGGRSGKGNVMKQKRNT